MSRPRSFLPTLFFSWRSTSNFVQRFHRHDAKSNSRSCRQIFLFQRKDLKSSFEIKTIKWEIFCCKTTIFNHDSSTNTRKSTYFLFCLSRSKSMWKKASSKLNTANEIDLRKILSSTNKTIRWSSQRELIERRVFNSKKTNKHTLRKGERDRQTDRQIRSMSRRLMTSTANICICQLN